MAERGIARELRGSPHEETQHQQVMPVLEGRELAVDDQVGPRDHGTVRRRLEQDAGACARGDQDPSDE